MISIFLRLSFFFQAEDGIRDLYVTGVQTCALPIFRAPPLAELDKALLHHLDAVTSCLGLHDQLLGVRERVWAVEFLAEFRSEERRVGKVCSSLGFVG